jgi:hypothetical protein
MIKHGHGQYFIENTVITMAYEYLRSLRLPLNQTIKLESLQLIPIISDNKTRQGYVLRNILKQAGYFFLGSITLEASLS